MAKKNENPDPRAQEDAVADASQNAKLKHTDDLRDQADVRAPGAPTPVEIADGHSATTRDDALDLGVPMLPGSPDEPVGPEDALGPGPKRGDYSDRLGGSGYLPHEGGTPQRPRVENVGDAEGLKGGVETSES
jgi:hypothetical protein